MNTGSKLILPGEFLKRFAPAAGQDTKLADIDLMVELASHFLPAVITRGAVFAGINARDAFVAIASCEDLAYMILVYEGSHAMWVEMHENFKGNLAVKQSQVTKQPLHNYLSKPHTAARLAEIRQRVQTILGDEEGRDRANAKWEEHMKNMSKSTTHRPAAEEKPSAAQPMFQESFLG